VSPRLRSRRSRAARGILDDVPVDVELRARLSPGAFPAIDAAIREAEAERPSHLCAQTVAMALARAESDPAGAMQKLRRARLWRQQTPIGGYTPTRALYLSQEVPQ
jgi:hypothetical protein